MKTCQACGTAAEDTAATCAACGQASWCDAPKAEPQQDEPAGDPGHEPTMPRQQRRRR